MVARNYERVAHVLKPQIRSTLPSNLMFFDTETKDKYRGKDKDLQHHYLWFGYTYAFRYEQGSETRVRSGRFESPLEFFRLVEKRLDRERPLYVFAHNLGFDLTIVDFWQLADELGLELEYAVLEDPPLCIAATWKDCRILFLDTFNYWKVPLADMGRTVGIPKLDISLEEKDITKWNEYCKRDVRILAEMVKNLFRFITKEQLGSFAISAPGFAMNTFKRRFLKKDSVYVHDRFRVLELERAAYYGGLVTNFYCGKVSGPIYHCDINSLYPYVMQRQYPVKLHHSARQERLVDLRSKVSKYGAVASVLIRSDIETYPKRYQDKLCDVRGRFHTYLSGIELVRALERNHITYVNEVAYYEQDYLFKEYVNYFWTKRLAYKQAGDVASEQFCKLCMNSLYGKFGQLGYEWREINKANIAAYYDHYGIEVPQAYRTNDFLPILKWGDNKWFAMGLDHPITVRYFNGIYQMKHPKGEHYESTPIVAAFVTAYARDYLRELIHRAGRRNVYYCDTDSLFLNTAGFRRLSALGFISENILGKLKLENVYSSCTFFGPKDYIADNKVTLKGIKKNAKKIREGVYTQDQFEKLKSVLKRVPEPYITIKKVTKHLKREYNKGIVTASGWVEPFILNDLTV